MTNEEIINTLKSLKSYYNDKSDYCEDGYVGFDDEDNEAIDIAIKLLEQKSVLDNIKAEILDEAEYAYADFDRYKEDILHAEPDELPDDDFRYGLERAVEIINKYKYKAESENEG